MEKELTPIEYADMYGCKPQYIQRILKENKSIMLPHIIDVKRYGRFYVIVVPKWLSKRSFKKKTS